MRADKLRTIKTLLMGSDKYQMRICVQDEFYKQILWTTDTTVNVLSEADAEKLKNYLTDETKQ